MNPFSLRSLQPFTIAYNAPACSQLVVGGVSHASHALSAEF